jgi:hypothetical protein
MPTKNQPTHTPHRSKHSVHTFNSPIAILQQRIQQCQSPGLPMNIAILQFLSNRPSSFPGPDNQHVHIYDRKWTLNPGDGQHRTDQEHQYSHLPRIALHRVVPPSWRLQNTALVRRRDPLPSGSLLRNRRRAGDPAWTNELRRRYYCERVRGSDKGLKGADK